MELIIFDGVFTPAKELEALSVVGCSEGSFLIVPIRVFSSLLKYGEMINGGESISSLSL